VSSSAFQRRSAVRIVFWGISVNDLVALIASQRVALVVVIVTVPDLAPAGTGTFIDVSLNIRSNVVSAAKITGAGTDYPIRRFRQLLPAFQAPQHYWCIAQPQWQPNRFCHLRQDLRWLNNSLLLRNDSDFRATIYKAGRY